MIIANLLPTLDALVPGQTSTYHRLLSKAHGSGRQLAASLLRILLRHFWLTECKGPRI
jgi:hypothetical protein